MRKIIAAAIVLTIAYSGTCFADLFGSVSEASHVLQPGENHSPTDESEVQIYTYKPSFPFKVIGTVDARGMAAADALQILSLSKPGEKEDVELAMRALKREAASIGADGVIIAHQRQVRVSDSATERRITGIAILSQPIAPVQTSQPSYEPQAKVSSQAVLATVKNPVSSSTISGRDGSFSISLPSGWVQTQNQNYEISAKNPVLDIALLINSIDRKDVADWNIYAKNLQQKLLSSINEGKSTAIKNTKIRGLDAMRVDVSGVAKNGVRLHFLGTMLKADKKIVWILSACLESKYDSYRTELENIASFIDFK
ncbi:MAG: hypothetical protein WCK63_04625 [Betaproteobacteria bacterium]